MMLQFKAFALASLAAIAHVEAFVPHFAIQQRGTTVASVGTSTLAASFLQNWQKSMSPKPPGSNPDTGTRSASDSDLSIPYDAAARLAYDEWRKKFDKGDFNQARFESFKSNYEAVAVANVIAAREAREASVAVGNGAAIVTENKMELNENADMTLEEYEAAQKSVGGGKSADEMSQVLKAAGEVQDEASAALREAGAALAAEEEKLARKLGLKSVDELEAAVDAMEGIAEDGGELDPQNLAREARIRSAYLSWCKKYGKDVDEKRFAVFEQNFLSMEEFAKENKKEMVLNQYADCTEEEYLALTTGASPAPAPPKVEKKTPKAEASPKEDEKKYTFGNYKPGVGVTSEPVTKKKPAPEPTPKEKAVPAPKAKAAAAPKAKPAAAPKAKAAAAPTAPKAKAAPAPEAKTAPAPKAKKTQAPKSVLPIATVDGEKGRKARQAAQEKEAEKLRLENEAAAIALAREQAEREAAQIAKRRAIDEEAANVERAKAAEALAKIAKAREAEASSVRRPAPKPKPKVAVPGLSNLFKGPAKKETDAASDAKAKQAAARAAAAAKAKQQAKAKAEATAAAKAKQQAAARAKKEAAAAAKAKQEAAARARQEAAAAAKAKQDAAARAKKEAAAAAKTSRAGTTAKQPAGFSLFKSSPAPKAAPAPAPAPSLKLAPVSKIDTSDPVSDAFKSLFGGPKKAEKKATPAPAPAPEPVPKKESFAFSFGKPTPKKVVSTPKPSPIPSPAVKKEPFSFFAKAPVKKSEPVPPVPAPAPKKEPFAFSFGAPKAAPKPTPVQAPATVVKKAEPFSFFGKPSPKKVTPQPAPVPAPSPKSPAFSFGFGGKPAAAPKPPAAPAEKKAVPVRRGLGTFQIPGAMQKEAAKKAAPAPVKRSPTLSLFGGGAAKPKAQVAKKEAPAPVKRSPTLSLFGGGAAKPKAATTAVKDNIPVLRNFVQNADGSLTGNVSNSKNFRNGERITTSPVRRGVKAGTVVRTGSGSQYRLQ